MKKLILMLTVLGTVGLAPEAGPKALLEITTTASDGVVVHSRDESKSAEPLVLLGPTVHFYVCATCAVTFDDLGEGGPAAKIDSETGDLTFAGDFEIKLTRDGVANTRIIARQSSIRYTRNFRQPPAGIGE